MRPALLVAMLALAGCATAEAPAPAPDPNAGILSELIVPLAMDTEQARPLIEDLAANCWLNALGGANLVADRAAGRVVIVSDSADILSAELLPADPGRARLHLDGPALADPVKAGRIFGSLDNAVKTGATSCPAG